MSSNEDDISENKYGRSNNAQQRYGRNFHWILTVFTVLGLYQFTCAFFLSKRSMPHTSDCNDDSASVLLKSVIGLTNEEVEMLYSQGILSGSSSSDGKRDGCWMRRRVDGMAIIVVDALRFDFAVSHLPKSIGKKIESSSKEGHGLSQIFQFVADPPTVTMQRLKGMTTGGLPTFADISANFGGATVDEDSWVQQLRDVPTQKRGYDPSSQQPLRAFVGDDTWIDLFPGNYFDDCHPYPSFNTRDLDTVDNGCLLHLPRLFQTFGSTKSRKQNDTQNRESFFEVLISHFLGVDHVGHTYGPNTPQMDKKLNQIDDALDTLLQEIDRATDTCQVAFIFGDHGMTEDGNHGGGTNNEINAALFAHFSKGCGDLSPFMELTGSEAGEFSKEAFQSIHQIDLVPTISLLLGLPIPYANLGAAVPALIPLLPSKNKGTETNFDNDYITGAPIVAAALALNAAQVWNYISTYSKTAHTLPIEQMADLKSLLDEATGVYKSALSHKDGHRSALYDEACGLYRYFLLETIAMGKRVWTRFDIAGMIKGIGILLVSLLIHFPPLNYLVATKFKTPSNTPEVPTNTPQGYAFIILLLMLSIPFMIFQTVILTFSNSYINAEKEIIMFFLAILCIALTFHSGLRTIRDRFKVGNRSISQISNVPFPLLIALCSRANSAFIMGHGLDPSLRQYVSHDPSFFLPCLLILGMIRYKINYHLDKQKSGFTTYSWIDFVGIIFLGLSWCEKGSPDSSLDGYVKCRIFLCLIVGSFFGLIVTLISDTVKLEKSVSDKRTKERESQSSVGIIYLLLFKLILLLAAVTGPSASASSILFVIQIWALHRITIEEKKYTSAVVAFLWRLTIRHSFFATGHACSFNRLQVSAAFIATDTFYFASAGLSLFFNTFGWELIGNMLVYFSTNKAQWHEVSDWYHFLQLLETATSCVSVSIMRRHLMLWAIFAPRFVFAVVFLLISLLFRVVLAY